MTRENKLALVVGFGLILFVGILISDHFSTARTQAAADFTAASNKRVIDPLGGEPVHEGSQLVDLTPQDQQPIAANPGTIEQPQNPVAPTTPTMPQIQDLLNSGEMQVVHNPEDGPHSNVGASIESSTAAEALPANWQMHEVLPGETFYAICRQHYGDVSLVKGLAKANSIDDPGALRVGQKLRMPTAAEIGGKSTVKTPAPTSKPNQTPGAVQPAAPGTPALPALKTVTETRMASDTTTKPGPTDKASTYTVKSGDSLASIAERFLGSQHKWKKIYELNRQVIDDPDDVKVGTVLKLL